MPRPIRSLSIVIPAFNEAPTVAAVIREVLRSEALALSDTVELVVVDDGSTDGTAAIIDELIAAGPAAAGATDGSDRVTLRAVRHTRNLGKGAGLRSGFAAATGELVIVQDADLEYDPRDYAKMLRPLWEGRADVVYGSRFLPSERRVLLFWHSIGNSIITLAANAATDLNLSDVETGYKAFRSSVLQKIDIESDRFGVEIELTAKVAQLECRIYEVPIAYHGRSYAQGKKITWKDGVDAMFCIVRFGPARRLRQRLMPATTKHGPT
ncbi:MAG: glycosyltransferase family 2 protein [Myxococcales bacterium]|nr:glycosyltransferase family 2 protein [Myxococcales bacterium]